MKFHKLLIFITFIIGIKINAQSTASKQVSTFIIEAPQMEAQKKIWVYLPIGYETSQNPYPVIYMHDAQNLFDEKTSYVGEWKIDEYLDTINENQSIIVGIEHGNEKRIDELTPYVAEKYGGGKGDLYLDFIVQQLKPKIDSTYNTLKEPKHTTIFGSSLGGLISLYAVIKYPGIFGKAGIFSLALWINKNEMFEYVKRNTIDPDKRFYFLVGSEEGKTMKDASSMVSDQHEMVQILLDKGINDKNIEDKVIPDGHHNETLWSSHFPEAYQWLINN